MEELSLILQAVILTISQFVFIYFRTLNVAAQIQENRLKLFWTVVLVHITWLAGTALGVGAILNGNYWLVIFSLIGSCYGADRGFLKQMKNKK